MGHQKKTNTDVHKDQEISQKAVLTNKLQKSGPQSKIQLPSIDRNQNMTSKEPLSKAEDRQTSKMIVIKDVKNCLEV